MFEDSGRWDEQYRFGGEDIDLSTQVGRARPLVYVGSVEVVHHGRVSSRKNIGFSAVAQGLATRIGVRRVLPVGMAIAAGTLVLFAQLPVHGHYFFDLFPAFLLGGIGLALAFVPMQIAALTGVSQSDAGVASGLINTSQQIGGAIGVAAATTVATTFTSHYVNSHPGTNALTGSALTHGFQITFYVLAGFAALGALLGAILIESKPSALEQETVGEVAFEAAA